MTKQAPQETITHWPNSQLKCIRNYLHRAQHGRQQGWHENGQPFYDTNYSHGEHHGLTAGLA